MLKPTKRKAFNFLRSYFDVLNEIPDDKDKLDFLLAVLNKQFLNEDPKGLEFIANLCYESQRHAIEKSVKGWISVNNTDIQGNPIAPSPLPSGSPLGSPSPLPSGKEEEEEKEEENNNKENRSDAFLNLVNGYTKQIGNGQSATWISGLYMQCKLKDGALSKLVDLFNQHLMIETNGKWNKSFLEYRKHCGNWIRHQYQQGKIGHYTKDKPIGSL